MATTTAKGSGSTVNDGGTIVNAGTPASDSRITDVLNPNDLAISNVSYGSKVVSQDGTAGDYAGVTTASGGSGGLAFYPSAQAGERNFLIRGAGSDSSKINNDASTVLSVPGSEYASRASLHGVIDTRRYGSAASTSFNILARPSSAMVPGRTKGSGAGSASTFVNPVDGSPAVDSEIFPTRTLPGELTYHFGGLAKPTTDEYKARDSQES